MTIRAAATARRTIVSGSRKGEGGCSNSSERREAYSAGVVVAAGGGVTGAEPLSSTGEVQPATMLTQKTTRLQTTRVVRFDIESTLLSVRQQTPNHPF